MILFDNTLTIVALRLKTVMAAELIHHYHPKLVDLHNYSPQNSQAGRIRNWETLNRKVLAKLGFRLSAREISGLSSGETGSSEVLLRRLRDKVLPSDPSWIRIPNLTVDYGPSCCMRVLSS